MDRSDTAKVNRATSPLIYVLWGLATSRLPVDEGLVASMRGGMGTVSIYSYDYSYRPNNMYHELFYNHVTGIKTMVSVSDATKLIIWLINYKTFTISYKL